MNDAARLDPEMAVYQSANAALAATFPPLEAGAPVEAERDYQERLMAVLSPPGGEPAMAEASDRWIGAHGRRMFCRLYRPTDEPSLPVMVYIHGGGWRFSSVDTHDIVARLYAAASGATVVSVDYALAPEAKFPRAIEECAAVIRRLGMYAADWNIDASRIVVAGDSSGGGLALGTALLLRDTKGPQLRGVFAAYPVCDCDFESESYREHGNRAPLTAERMKFFWRNYVRDPADMLHPLASPLRADLRGFPPTLLLVAELDVLRSEALALGEKLRAAGVDVELEVLAGLTHGFIRAAPKVTKSREAVAKAGRWLKHVLA